MKKSNHKVRYSFVGRAVNLPGKFGQSGITNNL